MLHHLQVWLYCTVHRLWGKLHEPRVITAAFGAAWLVLLGVGIVAVAWPPLTVVHHLGPILTATWGWLLLIGGALGLIGCPPGWWWVERAGITAASTGALIYMIVILTLHPPGSRLIQAGWVAVCLVGMVARWTMIRGAQLDPRARPHEHH